jgi:hypothetical protein
MILLQETQMQSEKTMGVPRRSAQETNKKEIYHLAHCRILRQVGIEIHFYIK